MINLLVFIWCIYSLTGYRHGFCSHVWQKKEKKTNSWKNLLFSMFGVNERDLIKSLRIKSKVQTHVYTITLFRGLLELDLDSIELVLS